MSGDGMLCNALGNPTGADYTLAHEEMRTCSVTALDFASQVLTNVM